jgi:hypothetical protein
VRADANVALRTPVLEKSSSRTMHAGVTTSGRRKAVATANSTVQLTRTAQAQHTYARNAPAAEGTIAEHREAQRSSLLLVAVIVLTAFGPRIRSCPGFAPRLPAAPPRAPLGDRGVAAASTGVQARRASPRQLTRLTGKISASESPAINQPHHLHHHQQPCTHDRPQHLKKTAVDKATAPPAATVTAQPGPSRRRTTVSKHPAQPPRQQPGLRRHEK